MIITYLRSSSYNSYDYCSHKYFLQYVLGLQEPVGKAASLGTITHKYLELLALRKLAEQNNEKTVKDIDLPDSEMELENITIPNISWFVYKKITSELKHIEWNDAKDYKDTVDWANVVINYKNGIYNPLILNIKQPEFKFDFVLERPEFKYNYTINNEKLEGYLGIKGTVDLVVEHNSKVLEIIDYKTGSSRRDWAKNKIKEVKDLYEDFQLLLYYYVAKKTWPDKDILTTIYFVRAGGPYTMDFNEYHIEKTENMIKERFNEIRKCTVPTWIKPDFRCKFCDFNKVNPNISKTTNVCEFFRQQIIKNGIQNVTNRYIKDDALTSYSGGGKR